jgi:hypothetical protein
MTDDPRRRTASDTALPLARGRSLSCCASPSPPAEKAGARQDEGGKASTSNGQAYG